MITIVTSERKTDRQSKKKELLKKNYIEIVIFNVLMLIKSDTRIFRDLHIIFLLLLARIRFATHRAQCFLILAIIIFSIKQIF